MENTRISKISSTFHQRYLPGTDRKKIQPKIHFRNNIKTRNIIYIITSTCILCPIKK